MKPKTLIAGSIVCVLLAGVSLRAAEGTVRLGATQGSKVRIEGTANMIHTRWAVESKLIGGSIEAGPNFPVDAGQAVTPGKVDAKVDAFIPVRSLKSVEDDGKPYSDSMDDIMYDKLKAQSNSKILFHLTELILKEVPKTKEAPFVFDSKGDLVVAGVTNSISMPVNVTVVGEKKLKITGNVAVKMSQFKIEPPAPKIALGALKTGDEVKLFFEWMVEQKKAPAAAK
jgi:hypothetical protein